MEKSIENERRQLVLLAAKPFVKEIITFLMDKGDYTQNQTMLANQIGHHPTTISIDIRKMASIGIVQISPKGREKYYRLDKDKAYQLLVLIKAIEDAFMVIKKK